MKKFVILGAALMLSACAEKAPLTPEQQWQGYCTSVGNAGRSIMLDRQNGIEKAQAIEHANKVEDETTKTFVLGAIEEVYAMPLAEINDDVTKRREAFKAKLTEKCIATPYDTLPDYKPF